MFTQPTTNAIFDTAIHTKALFNNIHHAFLILQQLCALLPLIVNDNTSQFDVNSSLSPFKTMVSGNLQATCSHVAVAFFWHSDRATVCKIPDKALFKHSKT